MIKLGLGQGYSPRSGRNSFSLGAAGLPIGMLSQLIKGK